MATDTHNTLGTDADFDIPQACDATDEALISTLDAQFAECCIAILEGLTPELERSNLDLDLCCSEFKRFTSELRS